MDVGSEIDGCRERDRWEARVGQVGGGASCLTYGIGREWGIMAGGYGNVQKRIWICVLVWRCRDIYNKGGEDAGRGE